MCTFSVESVLQGYHEYKDNWPEGSNFAFTSARGWRYFKIDIFASKFAPQVSTYACDIFLSRRWEFCKNGDKFGGLNIGEWQSFAKIAKVSPTTILCYTVYLWSGICYSYNTGMSALPDIYAQRPRADISGEAQVSVL